MSYAITKLDKMMKTTDPRLSFDNEDAMIINEAGSQILYQKYPATNYTGNILQFNTVQSPTIAIASKVFVECTFEVTLSGTPDGGTTLYQIANDAPRFMPLMSVSSTAVLQINGQSMTVNPNYYGDALFRYMGGLKDAAKDLSGAPSMFDYYQQYADYLNFGSSLNSLASIGEAGPGIQPRGGFPLSIDATDPDNVKITFTTFEPVIIPPCDFGHELSKAFIGVDRFNLTYNLENDLARVWSRNNTNSTPVTVTAKIVNTPQLCLTTITPQLLDMVPRVNRYPYSEVQPQSQQYGSLAPGASTKISFNAQQLQGVPERMYIFARRTTRTALTSDTYMRIENLNIQFDNETGIFAGAVPQQLYSVCVENGYTGSFSDWYQYSGSVMCVDFRKDIPLQTGLAVGVAKNITFRFDCEFKNIAADAHDFIVYLVVVYQGVFTISINGGVDRAINILSQQDVVDTKTVQALPYHEVKNFLVHGGSFFGKLKSVGKFARKAAKKAVHAYDNLSPETKGMIGKLAKDAVSVVSPGLANFAADLAPEAMHVARTLVGEGYSENQIYQLLAAKYGKGRKAIASKKTTGGKKLTKAQLLRIAQG